VHNLVVFNVAGLGDPSCWNLISVALLLRGCLEPHKFVIGADYAVCLGCIIMAAIRRLFELRTTRRVALCPTEDLLRFCVNRRLYGWCCLCGPNMPVHITTPRLQCAARCADAAAVVTKSLSRSVLLHMLISAAALLRLCCLLYCAALSLLYCAALSLLYCAAPSLLTTWAVLLLLCMGAAP